MEKRKDLVRELMVRRMDLIRELVRRMDLASSLNWCRIDRIVSENYCKGRIVNSFMNLLEWKI